MSCPLCKPTPAAHLWREREKTLAWEGEPVLVYTVQALALPSAPARVERCYRRVEAVWAARWEKSLYPRACAALRAARAASRPFRPWEASLSASVTLDTPERLSLYWEAAERLDGPHAVTLRRGDAWALPRGCPSPWPSCSRRGFGGGAGCWRRPPGSCGPGRHPGSPASGRTGSAAWPAASIRSGFSSRRRGRRCSSRCTPWGPMWRASPPFRSASPRKRKRRFPPNFRACLKHVNMPNRRAFCPLDSAIFP